jgi:hypothetical protein
MTATASRNPTTGRYAPRAPIPVCATCGCMLAEDLAARLYCARQRCEGYRQPVDVVPGARLGTLTAADIEGEA